MNLFSQWEFGYMAVLVPVVMVLIYLVMRKLRWLGAVVNGTPEEKPKEMISAYIIITVCLGVFIGGLAQSTVDLGLACNQAGHKVVPCIMTNLTQLQ